MNKVKSRNALHLSYYFVCTDSEDESYILSHKTVDQCRKLFMHIHTAPTLGNYMKRFVIYLLSLTNHVCSNGQRHLTGTMRMLFWVLIKC